jgi:hypothetical protein
MLATLGRFSRGESDRAADSVLRKLRWEIFSRVLRPRMLTASFLPVCAPAEWSRE